jgi:hypothetical protein
VIHIDPRPAHNITPTDDSYMSSTKSTRRPNREATPTERLFAFNREQDRFTCELRKVGRWGVEARFLRNQQFLYSRRHKTRELAIAWAEDERKALEGDPRYRSDLKPLGWPAKSGPDQ